MTTKITTFFKNNLGWRRNEGQPF